MLPQIRKEEKKENGDGGDDGDGEVMDMFISLIVRIISPCVHISNHHHTLYM